MVADPETLATLAAARQQANAAWVQAGAAIGQGVLSVLTIFYAVKTAKDARKHEAQLRKEDANREDEIRNLNEIRRARTAVLALLPSFNEAATNVEQAKLRLDSGCKPNEIVRTGPNPEDVVCLWQVRALNSDLQRIPNVMADLGKTAAPIQTAYFHLMHLQSLFNELRSRLDNGQPEHTWEMPQKDLQIVEEELAKSVTANEKVILAISELFRGMGNEA
ncbi:hypothetical protein GCM10009552_15430 [Rothia nasimurium]|uniref:Uncharacterized protein n=1 Tax=Luteibacter anthropi TaxID=564369 RepID=A0A7X5UBD7_9GAMM|nr:hypothetical protein [Luteibacter anthropi]NII07209.1 hypothetical protein [Luteibacter anthropi]